MRAHINSSNREAGPVLEEATNLMKQKAEVETKQRILDAFRSHFVISDEDLTTLTSTAEPVNDEFFHVLTRVKKIHHDCQVLLGTENETLGLEVLEQSSKQLNAAFQKLYRWIQREFKTLDLENPQINASIRRSLRVLAERPVLFQSCLDFFAEAREDILSDSFYTALTGSSTTPDAALTAKPIEFYAHDPLRYVGDMLAWAHSATVSEREALEVLFISEGDEIARGIQAGLESEPWARPEGAEEVFDGRKALNQLVTRDLSSVARLLRQRTEQVIQSHEDATLAYKIANLIGFYRSTFSRLLGKESEVLTVLVGLEESAMRQFRVNMSDHVAAVQNDVTVAPADLSPPEFLEEALKMLKGLIKSYDTSLASVENPEIGFQPVLAEALDPFLNGCENIYKRLPEPDNDIFAINCLLVTRAVLDPYTFTSERISDMDDTIQEHRTKLIAYLHRYLLDTSGLQSLLLQLADCGDDMASVPALPAFQPDSLVATSQQLDDFLPSALMDAREHIKRLRSTKMIQEVTDEAADRFCEDFEFVETKILAVDEMRDVDEEAEEEGEGRSFRELFPRTSAEIRVLLS